MPVWIWLTFWLRFICKTYHQLFNICYFLIAILFFQAEIHDSFFRKCKVRHSARIFLRLNSRNTRISIKLKRNLIIPHANIIVQNDGTCWLSLDKYSSSLGKNVPVACGLDRRLNSISFNINSVFHLTWSCFPCEKIQNKIKQKRF